MGTGVLPGLKWLRSEANSHLKPMPKLRKSGSLSPRTLYTITACTGTSFPDSLKANVALSIRVTESFYVTRGKHIYHYQ